MHEKVIQILVINRKPRWAKWIFLPNNDEENNVIKMIHGV